MYVRIARARFDPSNWDEVLAAGTEQMGPALRQVPGFQSAYWAVDQAQGVILAVSIWDTKEHAASVREALTPAAGQRMEAAGVQIGPAEIYEMVLNM